MQSSKLDNYKPETSDKYGEDGKHGTDSPCSTLWGESKGYSSGKPERYDSPESYTSPFPPPIDAPPPRSHIGPPPPGSPVSPPFSTAEAEMADNAARSQSPSDEDALDEWDLIGSAGVSIVGESNQEDWRETREGQGEEGLPDPDRSSDSTASLEGPVPPPPTDLPGSRREDMICQKRSS